MKIETDIASLIPQKAPFVFIDTVEEVGGDIACTGFTIIADCPLVTNGMLTLAGLMENAAQTCATRAGNKIGFIGAVKQMAVSRFPRVGERIRTQARVIEEVMNISLMECITSIGEEQIATTTLKIATAD